MTNEELQGLVARQSRNFFDKPFQHRAYFNARLRTTGGRYLIKSHDIEINPLMLSEFDETTLIGVIKHELVHYHNHLSGRPYQHKDAAFKLELLRVGGSRFAPQTSQTRRRATHYLVYKCTNGHQLLRQRRLDVNRYVCGECGSRLLFVGELTPEKA